MKKYQICATIFAIVVGTATSSAWALGSPAAIQAATIKLQADQGTLATATAAVASATSALATAQSNLTLADKVLIAARAHPQNYANYRMAAYQQLAATNAFNAANTTLNNAKANLVAVQALVANDTAVLAALSI